MDRLDRPARSTTKAIGLLGRFTVFAIPLVVVLAAGESALWQCGEAWPVSYVVRVQQQSASPVLYSRNLMSQQFGIYKIESICQRKPDLVIVGSSRVMQFRDFMFGPHAGTFFNAGGMIQSVSDFSAFADLIDQKRIPPPRIIIVGIDPWWIKQDHERDTATWLHDTDDVYRFAAHIEALRTIATKRHHREAMRLTLAKSLSSNRPRDTIGIAAASRGSGFRPDGSWQYSRRDVADWLSRRRFVDRERPPVIQRIKSRIYQFTPPLGFDPNRQRGLLQSIEKLQASDIEVWAFMPPLSSQSRRAIVDDPAFDELWNGYQRLFCSLKIRDVHTVTLNMTDQYNLPDSYMIDGFHPGEVYSACIALTIIDNAPPESILQECDAADLSDRIGVAENPLIFHVPRLGPDTH